MIDQLKLGETARILDVHYHRVKEYLEAARSIANNSFPLKLKTFLFYAPLTSTV